MASDSAVSAIDIVVLVLVVEDAAATADDFLSQIYGIPKVHFC